MLATIVILGIIVAAFFTTLYRNVAATFTYVLLPSLLMIFTVRPLEIEKLPDVSTLAAVGYGTFAALIIKGGEPLGIRLGVIDILVAILSLVNVVAAGAAEQMWTSVSVFGEQFFEFIVPYFMGRVVFADPFYRRRAAMVLTGLCIFIALVALFELRFKPLVFSRHVLKPLGLSTVAYEMVLQRYNLFRAQATFAHPIDLGNGGALLVCLIVALATTSGSRVTTPWVMAGIAAASAMVVASLSFTSFVAVAGIVALFILARATRLTGLLLLPISVAVITGYAIFTVHLVNTPLERPDLSDEALQGSYYIRHFIIQQAWPFVETAGLFGHGRTFSVRHLGLKSLDNAYLLFIIRHGWLYLITFLMLLVAVTVTGGIAIMRIRDGHARAPMAIAVAGIVGTMLGMYTVFFGFVYARLFIILLGITVTMCHIVEDRANPRRQGQLPPPPHR